MQANAFIKVLSSAGFYSAPLNSMTQRDLSVCVCVFFLVNMFSLFALTLK